MQLVHVPSFGKCEAKPAGELVPGDVIMHSFGYKSDVVSLVAETDKSIIVHIRAHESGFECDKRYLKTRLVPVKT